MIHCNHCNVSHMGNPNFLCRLDHYASLSLDLVCMRLRLKDTDSIFEPTASLNRQLSMSSWCKYEVNNKKCKYGCVSAAGFFCCHKNARHQMNPKKYPPCTRGAHCKYVHHVQVPANQHGTSSSSQGKCAYEGQPFLVDKECKIHMPPRKNPLKRKNAFEDVRDILGHEKPGMEGPWAADDPQEHNSFAANDTAFGENDSDNAFGENDTGTAFGENDSDNDPILVDCGVITEAPEAEMFTLVNCGLIVSEEDGQFIHTGGPHSRTSPPTAKRQRRPEEKDFEDGRSRFGRAMYRARSQKQDSRQEEEHKRRATRVEAMERWKRATRLEAMEQFCRARHLLPVEAERNDEWAKRVGYRSYEDFLHLQCVHLGCRATERRVKARHAARGSNGNILEIDGSEPEIMPEQDEVDRLVEAVMASAEAANPAEAARLRESEEANQAEAAKQAEEVNQSEAAEEEIEKDDGILLPCELSLEERTLMRHFKEEVESLQGGDDEASELLASQYKRLANHYKEEIAKLQDRIQIAEDEAARETANARAIASREPSRARAAAHRRDRARSGTSGDGQDRSSQAPPVKAQLPRGPSRGYSCERKDGVWAARLERRAEELRGPSREYYEAKAVRLKRKLEARVESIPASAKTACGSRDQVPIGSRDQVPIGSRNHRCETRVRIDNLDRDQVPIRSRDQVPIGSRI